MVALLEPRLRAPRRGGRAGVGHAVRAVRRRAVARAARSRPDDLGAGRARGARLLRRPALGRAQARARAAADRRRLGRRRPVVDAGDICRWGAWLRDREPMHGVQAMADPEQLAPRLGARADAPPTRRSHPLRARRRHAGLPCGAPLLPRGRRAGVRPDELLDRLLRGLRSRGGARRSARSRTTRASRSCGAGTSAPPAEIEELLGIWWFDGDQVVFSWRDGHLEAQFTGAPPRIKPSVFEQDGPGRFHVVSGRERGERLEVVRDEVRRGRQALLGHVPVHARAAALRAAAR